MLEYLDSIRNAAVKFYQTSQLAREVLGSEEDAVQCAALHCWKYWQRGWRPKNCSWEQCYGQLAKQGIWDAIRRFVKKEKIHYSCEATEILATHREAEIELDLNILNEIECQVVTLKYGLFGCGQHTRQEIAEILKLTPRQVGSVITAAYSKLSKCRYEDIV